MRIWIALVAVMVVGQGRADEEAVRSAIGAYVKAYNEKNLDAIGNLWAKDAIHTDRDTGERVVGRDAIKADIEKYFREGEPGQLSGRIEVVDFITADVARVAGYTSFAVNGEQTAESMFTVIMVNDGGHWLIRSVDEAVRSGPRTANAALQPLQWLVGNWQDDAGDRRVNTSVRWSMNENFLLRSFVVEGDQGVELQGTQVIGWDPRAQVIRSWTFHSDGSFGHGEWTPSGEEWLIKANQTTADGAAATGTYVFKRLDENSLSLQLVGHEIDGVPQPSAEAIVMVRVKEEANNSEPAARP